jgi:hypothetical protein
MGSIERGGLGHDDLATSDRLHRSGSDHPSNRDSKWKDPLQVTGSQRSHERVHDRSTEWNSNCRGSQYAKDQLCCRPRNSRPISETGGQGRHRSRSREPGVSSRHEMSRDCPPHAAQTWFATGLATRSSAGCCTHSEVTFKRFPCHVASCHLCRLTLI